MAAAAWRAGVASAKATATPRSEDAAIDLVYNALRAKFTTMEQEQTRAGDRWKKAIAAYDSCVKAHGSGSTVCDAAGATDSRDERLIQKVNHYVAVADTLTGKAYTLTVKAYHYVKKAVKNTPLGPLVRWLKEEHFFEEGVVRDDRSMTPAEMGVRG